MRTMEEIETIIASGAAKRIDPLQGVDYLRNYSASEMDEYLDSLVEEVA